MEYCYFGILIQYLIGLGAWEPIGHVDFYPNGGKAQRGCQNLLIGGLYDFIYCE